MPTDRPAILVRNSDDFFPEIKESHPWHIFCNAGNAVFTQHLNVTPDWDMFQTVHDYSAYHAAGRCISGGPVYITDEPGKHNIDLIKQMTGPSVKIQSGKHKTVIFRPDNFGKTVDPYVAYEDEVLLKVGNHVGRSETGTSLLAVFNVSSRPITELMPLSKFPGLVEGKRYIIQGHNTGYVSKPILIIENEITVMVVKLPVCHCPMLRNVIVNDLKQIIGFEIYSAFPLIRMETTKNEFTELATLGLLGKMTGAAAVVQNDFFLNSSTGRIEIDVGLKALGVLGMLLSYLPLPPIPYPIFSSSINGLGKLIRLITQSGIYVSNLKHPSFSIKNNVLVTILGDVIPEHTVGVVGATGEAGVLHIDLEKAWEEMNLDGKEGWGNNAFVRVFLKPVV